MHPAKNTFSPKSQSNLLSHAMATKLLHPSALPYTQDLMQDILIGPCMSSPGRVTIHNICFGQTGNWLQTPAWGFLDLLPLIGNKVPDNGAFKESKLKPWKQAKAKVGVCIS